MDCGVLGLRFWAESLEVFGFCAPILEPGLPVVSLGCKVGVYWDNGKQNGNCCINIGYILGFYTDLFVVGVGSIPCPSHESC